MIYYDEYIVSYNKQAMFALKNDQIKVAFNLLSQANEILQRKQVQNFHCLQSLTNNNLGCFYKRSGDYQKALSCLHKSLSKSPKAELDNISLASTHLNICSIYSLLLNHPKALHHSIQALSLLKPSKKVTDSFIFTQINAYFNTAFEYESLSEYKKSLSFYKKALRLSLLKLGEKNKLTLKVKERLAILKNKIALCGLGGDIRNSKNFHTERTGYFESPQRNCKDKFSLTPFAKRNANIRFINVKKGNIFNGKEAGLNRESYKRSYIKKPEEVVKDKFRNRSYNSIKKAAGEELRKKTLNASVGRIRRNRPQKLNSTPVFIRNKRHLTENSDSTPSHSSSSFEITPIPHKSKFQFFTSIEDSTN